MKFKTIRGQIVTLGVLGIATLAVALLAVVSFQKRSIAKTLEREAAVSARQVTEATARETYLLCQSRQESLLDELSHNIRVAVQLLHSAGEIHLGSETVQWAALNQFSKKTQPVDLPKMLVGDKWFGQNTAIDKPSLVVDKVTELVGGVCTVFQRMNDQGDMLRICTNVKTRDSVRALGSYIPAIGTDQNPNEPNPVVSALMKGEAYHGMAFVVDSWYVAAYEPIFDHAHKVIGAVFVGIPRDAATSFGKGIRKGIEDIKVGTTGYVFVLGGKGAQQGSYIVSKDGKRNGENIWTSVDADGKPFIQTIVKKGLDLKTSEVGFERYSWKNEGETQSRSKIVAISYFAPWDWVICAGAYEDDLEDARIKVEKGLDLMVKVISLCAVVLCVLIGVVSFFAASNISRPIVTGVRLLDGISRGDLTQDVPSNLQERGDESGSLARALQATTESLRRLLTEVSEGVRTLAAASTELSSVSNQSNAGIRSTSERASTVASSAEELSASSISVAAGMEQATANLTNVASATEEVTSTIGEIAGNSERARSITEEASQQAQHVTGLMQELNQAAQAIGKVTEAITNISDQTKLLALNATIEAARAGAAGKGFAVVAHEIKELARQTTLATEDIKSKVNGIQGSTTATLKDLAGITSVIKQVSEIVNGIATAIEEQSSVTKDIARNVTEAATGVRDANQRVAQISTVSQTVAKDIETVNLAATDIAAGSDQVTRSTSELSKLAEELQSLVGQFKLREPLAAASPAEIQNSARGRSNSSPSLASDSHKLAAQVAPGVSLSPKSRRSNSSANARKPSQSLAEIRSA